MSENNVNCYEFDDFRLDVINFQLLENGENISLTQKSFELLLFLVENRGRILKKEELLDSLWEDNFVEEANLTQHIYMLRKALKQKERKKVFIETIPKNGYRFLATVEEIHISSNVETPKNVENTEFLSSNINNVFLNSQIDEPKDFNTRQTEETRVESYPFMFTAKYVAILSAIGFLLITATYFYYTKNTNTIALTSKNRSFAVLPFKQIDSEKDEKLGIGVADVLIARLANIEEIKVKPTTSIMRLANEDHSNLEEVGKKLNADFIIAGTIQRDNGNVRVTTQLYSVKEKKQLWTETIDEKYTDIFNLQDKISEKVAQKVLMGLDVGSSALSYRQYTTNIEAYQAYSMGLSFWSMHTQAGFEKAIRQFKKAVEIDPHFTLAYAYLADTYGHTSHISHLMTEEEARKKGEAAANNALELDPNCAEAMAALALIYANQSKEAESFELMRKSLEIKPNDAHSRHRISWMYANKGQIEKSIKEMQIAQKLDPQSAYINIFLGDILFYAGKIDDAIQSYYKALEIEPNSSEARWWLIKAFEQKGQFEEAEREIYKLANGNIKNNKVLMVVQSRIFAKNNKKQKAQRILNEVLSSKESKSLGFLIAQSYIALGEKEKALSIMATVIPNVKDNIYTIKYEPNLNLIRNNEKFKKLLKAKEDTQSWMQ